MWNWSHSFKYLSSEYVEATTIEQVQAVVMRSHRVRALGTRHSFSKVADTTGVHVSTLGIPPQLDIDSAAGRLRFRGGGRYAAIASFLTERGWALHNMGSLPHISVAGAVSTGTHGSGIRLGNLSTAVRGIELVGPDGDLRQIREGSPQFDGSVVALGLLGVIVGLELAIEPSYLVRQDVYRGLAWERFLQDPDAVLGAGYSVSVFTDWASEAIDQVWVKRRIEDPSGVIPDELCGALRDPRPDVQVIESADDNTTRQGEALPWSMALPHFRIDRTPSDGDEIQSEYFVARVQAAEALRALREVGALIRPALLVSELRTVAADRLWLSEAYEQDSLAIHFTWKNDPVAVEAACALIEQALEPFTPRPHWGKVHTIPDADLAARFPRLSDFASLRAMADPSGKFMAAALEPLLR